MCFYGGILPLLEQYDLRHAPHVREHVGERAARDGELFTSTHLAYEEGEKGANFELPWAENWPAETFSSTFFILPWGARAAGDVLAPRRLRGEGVL